MERQFRRYLDCSILAHGFARNRCGDCGHTVLIAFSCKGRGVDEVFPVLPVRQWVLSIPKRLRYFLQRDPTALSAVLHIFLRVIEARLRERGRCPGGRLGAVSFVHRFGSALNAHVHFHCCVIDGVLATAEDGPIRFAGMLGHALYLEAEAAGVRSTGIGCYFDDEMHELLGIDDDRWQSLYHFTIGGPIDDTRLVTFSDCLRRFL